MPARIISAWLVVVAACLLATGCGKTETNAKRPAPPPPKVTVAAPLKRTVSIQDEHVGRFVAVDSVEIKARVSGYLEKIHFRDGEVVEKGQPLFTIDRRPFEIALEQARANLQLAESNLVLANSDLARAKDLSVGSTISKQTLDQRLAAKRAAEAQVRAQTAATRQAELDLGFTLLSAPIKGRIGDRKVSVGNFVTAATTANATLLATIQSTDPMRLEFTLDEASYLKYMRARGDGKTASDEIPISIKLLDEETFAHKGRMNFMDNAMSRSSGTIRGRAEVSNPQGLFAPGMFARVRMALAPPVDRLLVPDAAIGTEQVRKFVLVVGEGNIAKPRYVTLGGMFQGLRVIESGIEASDRVIIDGLMRARAGVKVDPQPGKIETASAPPQTPSRTSANSK